MKLATIQKIKELKPIEGADKIELAMVLGWQVVVKKGEFNVGDLCCYIQIDTVVPPTVKFEFMKKRKYRIRTIKLRGALSQGLILPLNELSLKSNFKEGMDVTKDIGVVKYEKQDNNPILYQKPRKPKVWYKKLWYIFKYNYLYKWFPKLKRKERSKFPTNLVSITDEERIQNIPHILDKYKGKTFVASYKLDGSSITLIHSKSLFGKGNVRICSRRFELHDKNNDWYKVYKSTNFQYYIGLLVKHFQTNDIIVQGEAIGKFNGNHHKLNKDEIRLFNIYVNGERLLPNEFHTTCGLMEIPHCPKFGVFEMNFTLDEILKLSEIKDVLNPKVEAEGLVWRCIDDGFSFKVINNNYLLTEK